MNKEKVLWKNRISVRIPIIMALVIMVVMVIMSVCLNVLTRNTVTKMTDKELDYIAQKNSKIIESYMESMLVFSQALSLEVQRYQGMERENAQELLVDSLKGVLNNDKIFSAYYAFEPDKYFPETPQGLSYYAYRDGSKVGVDIFNDFDSYSGADYYAPTKQMRSTHVTAPYPWELTNGETIWLVTLSSPIISESGEFIGVANCDLDVRSIEALEYADGGYESSFSYIITNDGTCMAHTANPDAIGDVPPIVADDKELQEAILAGNAITKEVPNPYDRGKTALAIHNPVDLPGTDVNWYSAYVINKSEAMQAVTTTSLALAGIGASGLLVLILVSGFMLKRGLAPINQVMALAEKMGNCDLSSRENALVHTNDELGLLSHIFQDTSETLGSYIRQISEALDSISSGNLDFAIEQDFIGDFNQIKRDLNEIIDNLNRTFREMMVAAEQVATGAEQFSDGSQVMSQGAIEQASAIEELSEKITEITGQVEESARNAGQANGQAEQVNLELAASDSQMQQLLGAMSAIKDTSAQIGNIIKTIEDIAFQTNILALNAAVEAARAGEAGKGFAVVADEVRNLASKSAEAAKNTTVLIESAMASVQEGANFAEVTADSLAKLAEGTKQIIAAVAEISGKTENQFSSLKEVTDGIDQISTVVQKNAATAEESAATSEELSAQAQLLKEQIARFRLKNQ